MNDIYKDGQEAKRYYTTYNDQGYPNNVVITVGSHKVGDIIEVKNIRGFDHAPARIKALTASWYSMDGKVCQRAILEYEWDPLE